MILKLRAAVRTALLQAASCLSANTNTVTNLHVLNIRADSYGLADNLVANDTGWLESAW